MTTDLLVIENVTKVYGSGPGSVHALDGVSLAIHPGEVFSFLGVNGAGKTTLSSLIATLHPPTSGDITFQGVSIYKDIAYYRRHFGFCPQKQNLDEDLTVYENLLFAGRYMLMDEAVIAERIDELMTSLEIKRYASCAIDSLSGGTKQRVLIARALMHKPVLVILDEPTVGLDPDIRRKLWDLIIDLKRQGITVLLTTHYLDEAEALSDRLCILDKGKIRLIASMKELKEQYQKEESLEDIFLKLMHDYAKEAA